MEETEENEKTPEVKLKIGEKSRVVNYKFR